MKKEIAIILTLTCFLLPIVICPIGCHLTEIAYIDEWGISISGCLGRDMGIYPCLTANLIPTSLAKANTLYVASLYEKGELKGQYPIYWTQTELNVGNLKEVYFLISKEERDIYSQAASNEFWDNVMDGNPLKPLNWWKGIFSIEVEEDG